jgi:beta-phosphoglucomutase-like phosphatase (HAD superfamily)
MIRAVVFDRDGTLVQTERLKAVSYVHAVQELRPERSEAQVLAAFQHVIGRSREEVSQALVAALDLDEAGRRMARELGVHQPWQAVANVALVHLPARHARAGRRARRVRRRRGWSTQCIRELDANAKVIVSSGYSNDPVVADCPRAGFRDVVAEPHRIEELGEAVSRVITRP